MSIDIDNIDVGDVLPCGKTTILVMYMSFTMEHVRIRIGPNPPIRMTLRNLGKLLNPEDEPLDGQV